MVERLVHTEEVTGSMPVSPTRTPADRPGFVASRGRSPNREPGLAVTGWQAGEDPGSTVCPALTFTPMERLCERPGCSEPASVAYGMRPEDLVFWLDRLDNPAHHDGGVLCRRHADSMVVPRSWTLDDLRDPDLHLFRPPQADRTPRRMRRPATPALAGGSVEVEQLALGVDDAAPSAATAATTESAPAPATESATAMATASGPVAVGDSWSPSFDDADDLDGLLAARSPLLARAFRGDDRPRP